MSRAALAPGVYTIHHAETTGNVTNRYYVTDPNSDNETLTTTGPLTSAPTAPRANLQWLISGDGVIRSLDHDKKFASARLAPKTSGVLRSSAGMKWIISVLNNTGRIRADDGTARFWGARDANVELTADASHVKDWVFTSVG